MGDDRALPSPPMPPPAMDLVSLNELGEPLPPAMVLLRCPSCSSSRLRRRMNKSTPVAMRATTTNPTAVKMPATAPLLSSTDEDDLITSIVGLADVVGEFSDIEVGALGSRVIVMGEPVTVTTEGEGFEEGPTDAEEAELSTGLFVDTVPPEADAVLLGVASRM